jgi:hypothetical protein
LLYLFCHHNPNPNPNHNPNHNPAPSLSLILVNPRYNITLSLYLILHEGNIAKVVREIIEEGTSDDEILIDEEGITSTVRPTAEIQQDGGIIHDLNIINFVTFHDDQS